MKNNAKLKLYSTELIYLYPYVIDALTLLGMIFPALWW